MSKIRYFSINKRISESHSTYVMLKDLLFKRKQLREYSLITSGLFFLSHVQTLTLVNHFIFFFNFIFFQGIKAAGFISCLLFFTHPRNSVWWYWIPSEPSGAVLLPSVAFTAWQRPHTSQQENEDDLQDLMVAEHCPGTVIPSFTSTSSQRYCKDINLCKQWVETLIHTDP